MAGKKIMLYTLSTCSHCKSAKKYLAEKGIPFDFVEVDLLRGDEKVRVIGELLKHNPERSFPTIVIDDGQTVIVGFREERIREALDIQ